MTPFIVAVVLAACSPTQNIHPCDDSWYGGRPYDDSYYGGAVLAPDPKSSEKHEVKRYDGSFDKAPYDYTYSPDHDYYDTAKPSVK
jgi:hypothetical protein